MSQQKKSWFCLPAFLTLSISPPKNRLFFHSTLFPVGLEKNNIWHSEKRTPKQKQSQCQHSCETVRSSVFTSLVSTAASRFSGQFFSSYFRVKRKAFHTFSSMYSFCATAFLVVVVLLLLSRQLFDQSSFVWRGGSLSPTLYTCAAPNQTAAAATAAPYTIVGGGVLSSSKMYWDCLYRST